MSYGAVYITTNILNGKRYIGSFIYKRINGWESYLGSGVDLKKDIDKYGKENFTKEIVANYDSELSLRKAEELLILECNAVENPNYYNRKYSAIGGDTYTYSKDKEGISKKKSDKSVGKNNTQYGKPKTEEFIKLIREKNSRAIIIEGITYRSIAEASRELGIGVTTITYRIDSEGFPTYNRTVPKNKVSTTGRSNKKIPISVRGVMYESIAEASKGTGETTSKIRKRLKFDDDYVYI